MRLLWEINKDKKINLIQHEFYFFITFDHKIDFKSDKETVLPHFGQIICRKLGGPKSVFSQK